MQLPGFLYGFYERKLQRSLDPERIPRHVGVMVDGNRRWARQFNAPTSQGHQAGADKIHEFLGWCQELGIKVVTLYMLSTDNMNRSGEELDLLMQLVEEIAGLFRFARLAAFPQAVWVKTEHAPVFAPEHMEGLRQFTSILTFTFRVVR